MPYFAETLTSNTISYCGNFMTLSEYTLFRSYFFEMQNACNLKPVLDSS